MAQAKRKPTTSTPRKPVLTKGIDKRVKSKADLGPDAIVIKACISYAQMLAAHSAGFKADPDGDSKYSQGAADRYFSRATAALGIAAEISAQTAEGIQAKARIAPMVLDDSAPHYLCETGEAFFRSFADDARKFLDVVIEAERQAAIAAATGKAVQS